MKVLLTGASSFTGYHFAESLVAAGHGVTCTFTADKSRYPGVRGLRVHNLLDKVEPVFNTRFGDGRFVAAIEKEGFDLICCHGAFMENYRSPEFDYIKAIAQDTHNIANVFKVAKAAGAKGVIYTGTVFEPGEGAGSDNLRAVSIYGATKRAVYEIVKAQAEQADLPLAKFVVPNPFGTFEEPKLPSYLMKMWRAGEKPQIKTPDYIRDNIHADLLASCYRTLCERFNVAPVHETRMNPSQYVESQGSFVKRMGEEMRPRTGWACEADFAVQTAFPEPRIRINTNPGRGVVPDWDEAKAWDRIAAYYGEHIGLY